MLSLISLKKKLKKKKKKKKKYSKVSSAEVVIRALRVKMIMFKETNQFRISRIDTVLDFK